jgi:RpiR family carbohydrate utilization transcriptional regulator
MSTNQFLLKIRSLYSSFSKTEKKIADYVLTNDYKIIYMSVTELAENCEVGETSIIRFCRTIGLKGYQEFRLVLARESIEPRENVHEKIKEDDTIEEIIDKITTVNIQAIQNTSRVISLSALNKAIDAIIKADKVNVYGVGASSFTAGDALYKLMRIGINCESLCDAHLQNMSVVNLTQKSVAIGISFSGSTKDTVDSLSLAKKAGAFTIAITNYEKSPITKFADVVLLNSAEETPLRSGSLTAKIAQLQVLDVLYTGIALKLGDRAHKLLNRTADAVLPKLY